MYNSTLEAMPYAPLRWFKVLPMAAATTFGLLVFMYQLVYTEDVFIDERPSLPMPSVTWEEPAPIVDAIEQPDPPEPVERPPQQPKNQHPSDIEVAVAPVQVRYTPPDHSEGIGFNLGTPIEHFIVRPRYPGTALQRGIEGFVELRFDITPIGTTENIEVIRAEPQGVFEKAAISAVERWKYQPKKENGKAVYFRGLSKRVTFEMQEGRG